MFGFHAIKTMYLTLFDTVTLSDIQTHTDARTCVVPTEGFTVRNIGAGFTDMPDCLNIICFQCFVFHIQYEFHSTINSVRSIVIGYRFQTLCLSLINPIFHSDACELDLWHQI